MAARNSFYKKNKNDTIWWVDHTDQVGAMEFSFDKEKVFNFFSGLSAGTHRRTS